MRERPRCCHTILYIAHIQCRPRIGVLILALPFDAAIAKHNMRPLAERLQERNQLRVIEFKLCLSGSLPIT